MILRFIGEKFEKRVDKFPNTAYNVAKNIKEYST